LHPKSEPVPDRSGRLCYNLLSIKTSKAFNSDRKSGFDTQGGIMTIQYVEPLSRGISRTRQALFNPIDIKKWFVVGFTAFLAGLGDVGFSGWTGFRRGSKLSVENALYFPQKVWEWLINHPGWAILIAMLTLLAVVFGIILTWLSARGKFMFLDNVVRDQSSVVAPWCEYKKEGNSFFLFHLVWGFIQLPIVIAYLIYCFLNLQALYGNSGNSRALIFPAILAGLGLVAIAVITTFLFILLRDFVAPIMYRNRITTWQAIQKFFPLFLSNFFYFIGYGLFLLCLGLLILVGLAIAGCVTCCIGFVILFFPYINAVVLLPLFYTYRSFSIEFLEQFGPEYHIFPRPEVIPPEAGPITA
jgi:hypothetical protein